MRTESTRNGPTSNGPSSGPDLVELRAGEEPVLVELRLDEPERQLRRQHARHRHFAQDVRQRADVVLVRVREQDGLDVARVVLQVREVGKDEVDAEVLVAREREPGVDEDAATLGLVQRHVLADLAEAAERDDADALRHRVSLAGAVAERL